MRGTFTIRDATEVTAAGVPHKGHGVEFPPLVVPTDLGRAFEPQDELHAQRGQHVHQRHIGKAAVRGHNHAPFPGHALDPRNRPPDDRDLIAAHAPLQHAGIVRPPIDRHCSPPGDQRDDQQQVVRRLNRPIDGQSHRALSG